MKILDTPRSGSVAGQTASRNRFGQYYRTRAIPVQPRTPKQTHNRGFLAVGASAWRSLTDAQRTAWNDYAAQITRTDRLGSGYSPTGAQLFTGSSIISGTGGLTDPPATLPTWTLDVTGMLYVDPTPGPEAFSVTISGTSADNTMLVETSGPVSPGVTSSAAVRRWRSLPASALNLTPQQFSLAASPVSILNSYKFLFPSPVVGQVIWFRFTEIFSDGIGAAQLRNKTAQTFRYIVA